jgi:hypothetical protein
LETIAHKLFVGMPLLYVQIKFYASGSNNTLIIAVKIKAKWKFCTAAILLFYILQKYLYKFAYFSQISYRSSLQAPTLNGSSVAAILQVRTSCSFYCL